MERQYDPIHPRGTDWRGLFRRIWAPIGATIVLIAKFSFAAVKFFSIFIAVGGYALFWGWKFAVGFVLLINLINLIPVGILDGGSIWRSLQLARRSVEAPPDQHFAMGSTYPIALP